ncbi:MAG: hypothetical protein ACO3N7_03960 [Kiritimatiellia bacterium]
MKIFFDTSAWVPLLLKEDASERMWNTKLKATEIWAWRWMQIETEAALSRRQASSECWRNWYLLKPEVKWVDLDRQELDTLCSFNRALKLRSADAGHLFVFDRLFSELPELFLLSLDKEMTVAAKELNLPLHPQSITK